MNDTVRNSNFCREFDAMIQNTGECVVYESLKTFDTMYKEVHGYLSVLICVFGVVNNVINSIVLIQKTMINPINLILFGIALSDMTNMTSYLIYTVYLNLVTSPKPCDYPHSYSWVLVILLQSTISICTHIVSTFLVVTLASFRVWTLTNLSGDSRLRNRHSYVAMSIIICAALVFSGFNYCMEEIEQFHPLHFWFKSKDGVDSLKHIHFAFYGCVVKILCSVVLVVLTATIIVIMRQSNKRKRRLLCPHDNEGQQTSRNRNQIRDPYQKTTMLLVAVVLSFVFTEVPQGIINTMASLLPCFLDTVYIYIGDIMDLFVLINSSINFILYCAMSQQFRDTFRHLFCR